VEGGGRERRQWHKDSGKRGSQREVLVVGMAPSSSCTHCILHNSRESIGLLVHKVIETISQQMIIEVSRNMCSFLNHTEIPFGLEGLP
jgi:uncharacterized protein YwlG (UPF0340 family)